MPSGGCRHTDYHRYPTAVYIDDRPGGDITEHVYQRVRAEDHPRVQSPGAEREDERREYRKHRHGVEKRDYDNTVGHESREPRVSGIHAGILIKLHVSEKEFSLKRSGKRGVQPN